MIRIRIKMIRIRNTGSPLSMCQKAKSIGIIYIKNVKDHQCPCQFNPINPSSCSFFKLPIVLSWTRIRIQLPAWIRIRIQLPSSDSNPYKINPDPQNRFKVPLLLSAVFLACRLPCLPSPLPAVSLACSLPCLQSP